MSVILDCLANAPIPTVVLGAFVIFAIGVFATVAFQAAFPARTGGQIAARNRDLQRRQRLAAASRNFR